jgi:hypothetical protein
VDVLAEEHRFERAPASERPASDDGSFARVFPTRTVGTLGAFADIGLTPWPFLELTAGLRVDHFGDPDGDATGVDPRANARIALLPWLRSVTTFGVAHQRPAFILVVPGAAPTDKSLILQEGMQMSQALEADLPLHVLLQATGYYHTYDDLTDFLATCGPGDLECPFYARASGRSYGLEVLLQRSLSERIGVQLAYTLSRSERTVVKQVGVPFTDATGKVVPPGLLVPHLIKRDTFAADSDRTHVFHLVVGYEPAPGWHAAVRMTAYSGNPYSLVAYDDDLDPSHGTLVGKRNVPRTAGFFRLDLRLSKTWRIGRSGYVTAVLEGLNVTLAKETIYVDCRASFIPGATCGLQEFGPVTIPNLGITGGF